jgi:(R,R)-butanediol dehydrogenase/meso-butanediol dehydrogenase/diacetyl reductase
MRAAVLFGPDDLRVEDVPDPVPAAGEVAIDIAHNGLCGSDLKMISGGLRATTEPHPLTGHAGPQILGHEFAGIVAAVGEDVAGVAVGDRVCVQPDYHCGVCAPCRQGWTHLCEIITFHGVISAGGGLSERTTLPANMVHHLPDELTLEQGAMVEPMAVSHHAIERAGAEPGDVAAIIGGGPIGIGVALGLRARGVDDLVVAQRSEPRRAVLADLGFEAVRPEDLAAALARRTTRGGADIAFDCAGGPDTFGLMLGAVRVRGRAVVVAGSRQHDLTMTAHYIMHTEAEITGSVVFDRSDVEAVMMEMVAGGYPAEGWVEHVPLEQVVEEGIRPLQSRAKAKVLVDIA